MTNLFKKIDSLAGIDGALFALDLAKVVENADNAGHFLKIEVFEDTGTGKPVGAPMVVPIHGDINPPSVGDIVVVGYTRSQEPIILGTLYASTDEIPDYKKCERRLGHWASDSSITFRCDGSVDIEATVVNVNGSDITTLGSITVEDDGTESGSTSNLNFGENLDVTDDGDGTFTIDATGGGGGTVETAGFTRMEAQSTTIPSGGANTLVNLNVGEDTLGGGDASNDLITVPEDGTYVVIGQLGLTSVSLDEAYYMKVDNALNSGGTSTLTSEDISTNSSGYATGGTVTWTGELSSGDELSLYAANFDSSDDASVRPFPYSHLTLIKIPSTGAAVSGGIITQEYEYNGLNFSDGQRSVDEENGYVAWTDLSDDISVYDIDAATFNSAYITTAISINILKAQRGYALYANGQNIGVANLSTGAVEFESTLELDGIASGSDYWGLACDGTNAYFGDDDGAIYSYDISSGTRNWKNTAMPSTSATDRIIYDSTNDKVYASTGLDFTQIEPSTGASDWTNTYTDGLTSVDVEDGSVYATRDPASGLSNLYSVDIADGSTTSLLTSERAIRDVTAEGGVLLFSFSGDLSCVDPSGPTLRWSFTGMYGSVAGNYRAGSNNVIFPHDDEGAYFLNKQTGKLVGLYPGEVAYELAGLYNGRYYFSRANDSNIKSISIDSPENAGSSGGTGGGGGTSTVKVNLGSGSTFAIGSGNTSQITYDNVLFNTFAGTPFDTGTSTFTAPDDGVYEVKVKNTYNPDASISSQILTYIRDSGGATRTQFIMFGQGSSGFHTHNMTEIYELTTGEEIYIEVGNFTGTSINMVSSGTSTTLSITKL